MWLQGVVQHDFDPSLHILNPDQDDIQTTLSFLREQAHLEPSWSGFESRLFEDIGAPVLRTVPHLSPTGPVIYGHV